ncbi:MAG: outer membrane beta-barrel protein, partial [Alteraurantiacibacter sp.]
MRKFTTALMSATALVSLPAMAQDTGFYIGLGAGIVAPEDTEFEGRYDDAAPADVLTVEGDYGWEGEGVIGYDAGLLRFEVEGSYKNYELDRIQANPVGVPLFFSNQFDMNINSFDDIDPVGGDVSITSGMLNVLLDLGGNDHGFGVALGGGVGISDVDFDGFRAFDAEPGFIDDSDARFAWQAVAQLYAPLTHSIDASLKYKFHNVTGLD